MAYIVDNRSEGNGVRLYDSFLAKYFSDIHRSNSTNGWGLFVRWKYGMSSWEHLRDLKKSKTVEVSEYVVGNNISSGPSFSW